MDGSLEENLSLKKSLPDVPYQQQKRVKITVATNHMNLIIRLLKIIKPFSPSITVCFS